MNIADRRLSIGFKRLSNFLIGCSMGIRSDYPVVNEITLESSRFGNSVHDAPNEQPLVL